VNNRKNYNSIVFLTVYLGLVLVGGSAQVLANAATPRLFDIKTEIEFKDEFDNKPDDDEKINFTGSLDRYFDDVEKFIIDLHKLHRIEKFDLDYDKFEISQPDIAPCNIEGDFISRIQFSGDVANRWLEPAIKDARHSFADWNILSDCLEDTKSVKLKLSYDKTELKVEIFTPKSSAKRAEFLAEQFDQASKIYKVDEEKTIVKSIYENTTFRAENNQIFIVTRLPRGSIDSLLAEKDAQ
jgi:hypothetical protein